VAWSERGWLFHLFGFSACICDEVSVGDRARQDNATNQSLYLLYVGAGIDGRLSLV
jgi:hypothetical protein